MKICHVTSVHNRNDVRIYDRQCKLLARQADNDVSIISFDWVGEERVESVRFLGLRRVGSLRLLRSVLCPLLAVRAALREKPDVCHLHDPELIWVFVIARFFSRRKFRLIYDAHEDLPLQVLNKQWLPGRLRPLISLVSKLYLRVFLKGVSGVVFASSSISVYSGRVPRIEYLNFPCFQNVRTDTALHDVCYAGLLSQNRYIFELVQACHLLGLKLVLAGRFDTREYQGKVVDSEGWSCVDYRGVVNHEEVAEIYAASRIGISLLKPIENYKDVIPSKVYDYFSSNLPFVTTSTPAVARILSGIQGVQLIQDGSVESIKKGINSLLESPCVKASTFSFDGEQVIGAQLQFDPLLEVQRLSGFYQRVSA